jgi:hypothetical protein
MKDKYGIFNKPIKVPKTNLRSHLVPKDKKINLSWTREELILVLSLYHKVKKPLPSIADVNIIGLSNVLNNLPIHKQKEKNFRSPEAVRLKLEDFIALDSRYKPKTKQRFSRREKKMIQSGKKLVRKIWKEYSGLHSRKLKFAVMHILIRYEVVPTFKIKKTIKKEGISKEIKDKKSNTNAPIKRNPNWSRDEQILALDLYFSLGRKWVSPDHSSIKKLSWILNKLPIHKRRTKKFRNPNGVSMKLANFLSIDPNYSGKGLSNTATKVEKAIWKEFINNQDGLQKQALDILKKYKTHLLVKLKEDRKNEKTLVYVKHNKINNAVISNKKLFLILQNAIENLFIIDPNQNNPYLIKNKNGSGAFYVFIKCITSAYFKNKDVTRIQVDKRKTFGEIIDSKFTIVPIGYDVSNKVYVIWNPYDFKERLNQADNISKYSRLVSQRKAMNTGFVELRLTNNELVYILNKHRISEFLNNIDSYFKLGNKKINTIDIVEKSMQSKHALSSIDLGKIKKIFNKQSSLAALEYIMNINNNISLSEAGSIINLISMTDTPIITSNDSLDSTGGISKERLIHMSQESGIAFKIPAALRQILEVIILIKKDGISRPDATKTVAKRNNIRPQTVIDKYCRQLNLRAFEFDQLIAEEALINLKNLLKEKFPRYSNEIDNCLNDFPI